MIEASAPPIHVIVDGGPSITDWITAITGAAALLVALAAILPAWRQLRMLIADKEREQAACFAMWVEYKGEDPAILYANSGTVPVYDVHGKITMDDREREICFFILGTIGPTRKPVVDRLLSQMVNLEIAAILREHEHGEPAETRMIPVNLGGSVRVSVTFRDATGVTWQRTPDGQLAKEPH